MGLSAMFGLIPSYIKGLALLGIALALLIWHAGVQRAHDDALIDRVADKYEQAALRLAARHKQAALDREREYRKIEQQMQGENHALDQELQVTKKARDVSKSRADAAYARLFDTLAKINTLNDKMPGDDTAARQSNGTGAALEVVGSCAGTARDLGAEATRLRDKLAGLQKYVQRVCLRNTP